MKTLPLTLAAFLIIQSCSQGSNTSSESKSREQRPVQALQEEDSSKSIQELLSSDTPNIALAQLLIQMTPKSDPKFIEFVRELSVEDAERIIESLKENNQEIRNNYLFNGQSYQSDKDLLRNTIKGNQYQTLPDAHQQLRITTFAYIKNKALNDILTTYSKEASKLTEQLSTEVALELCKKDKKGCKRLEALAQESSKEAFIRVIRKNNKYVRMIDEQFKSSDLNENEQLTLLTSAAIAGGIYVQLNKYKSFKNIAREVGVAIDKIKDLGALLKVIDFHVKDTAKNISELKKGFERYRNDLNEMQVISNTQIVDREKVSSEKIYGFFYDQLLLGKKKNTQETNPSLLSREQRYAENFNRTALAVTNLTNNLSTFIDTTTKVSTLLGLRPNKEVSKVLKKAQEVSAVIGSVASVAAGYMTGGPLGAMSALSSSPMMGMMGGAENKNAAEFAEINRKLDLILENQHKIMELQLETMKLVKDLAILVDKYHQQEMAALADLRDQNLTILENQKALIHKDLLDCERLIDYQISSNQGFGISLSQIENQKKLFYSEINSLEDLRKTINSTNESIFIKCQSGLASAFGPISNLDSPLRATFAGKVNDNIETFEREKYLPLLAALKFVAQSENLNSIPLHFPVRSVDLIGSKFAYVKSASFNSQNGIGQYNLDGLISTTILERYLNSFLILSPLIEIDKSSWSLSSKEIVKGFLDNSHSGAVIRVRSEYLLSNALKATQTAIAQESILAGEPLLEFLYDHKDKILSSQDCIDFKYNNLPQTKVSFICSVRNNSLIMKNFMTYLLNTKSKRDLKFDDDLSNSINKKDSSRIVSLISNKLDPKSVKFVKGQIVIEMISISDSGQKIKNITKVPTPSEYNKGEIIYSENLLKLLQMQDLILNQLEKVAPTVHKDPEGLLKVLLLQKSS